MKSSIVVVSALLSLGSFTTYTLMDIGIQHLVYRLDLFHVIFLNNLFSIVFMLIFVLGLYVFAGKDRSEAMEMWKGWKPKRWRLHLILAPIALVGDMFIFYSFRFHSLGEVYTIVLTTPLFATLFARFFHNEKVVGLKWGCIFLGFGASLWALNPSYAGISLALVGVLSTSLLYAIWYLVVKYHAQDEGVMSIFVSSRVFSLVGLAIPAYLGATTLSWTEISINVGNGFGYFIGYVMIILATRLGNVSTVSSIHYVQLPLGILADAILYAVYPSIISICAGTLIVAAGLLMVAIDKREEFKNHQVFTGSY